jgi:hypothetical protein
MAEGFVGFDATVPREVMIPFASRSLTTPGPFDRDRWGTCSLIARLHRDSSFGRSVLNLWSVPIGDNPARLLYVTTDDITTRPRMVYMSYRLVGPTQPMTFTLRTAGDSTAMVAPLRRVISEFPTGVGGDVTTGIEYRDRTLTQVRALSGLVAFFGAVAVLLSCLGIYGMLAFTVNRRTPEIGVRLALGARIRDVIRTVATQSMLAVAVGVVLGTMATVAATRGVSSILFGVSPTDPWILDARRRCSWERPLPPW